MGLFVNCSKISGWVPIFFDFACFIWFRLLDVTATLTPECKLLSMLPLTEGCRAFLGFCGDHLEFVYLMMMMMMMWFRV